jgi:hypothetical protein
VRLAGLFYSYNAEIVHASFEKFAGMSAGWGKKITGHWLSV